MDRHRAFVQRAAVAALVLSAVWVPVSRTAQADAPTTRTIALRPTQGTYLRINFDYQFAQVLPPFLNEPALAGKKTARALIPTTPPTPVLRNFTDNEIYIKTDHNRDFSAGSFVTHKSRYDGHVLFDGLEVSTRQDALVIPYTIRMYTYETVCTGWFEVISGWTGQFELEGESWTLEVADNLDGQIDGHDLLGLRGRNWTRGMPIVRGCPIPETLFFAGHTFHLGFAFKSVPPEVVLEATLTEVRPAMGQLDIQAGACLHLCLREDRQAVLLSSPAGTLSLPVGNYRVENCILYDEQNKRFAPGFLSYDRTVPILPGQTTSLRLGAPLSNVVEMSRDRNLLHLKHRVIGAGGERYNDFNPRRSPSFTVYKGPVKIAGGTFPSG